MKPSTRKITVSAIMAALSVLLMLPFLEVPIPFLPPWLKIDISTLPVLMAGFAFGPVWGIAVQAVKSLVHIPMGTTGGIGELADFLVGTSMVLPASIIYAKLHSRKGALIGMGIGVLCMMIIGSLSNYFILVPLFFGADAAGGIVKALGEDATLGTYIAYGVLPFNLIKGVLISLVTFLLYKRLSPLLHGMKRMM